MDEQFFDHHAPTISRFFRGLIRDDVADLVQETFVRYLENQHRIREGTDPVAYLLGIAQNVFHEHLRKLARDRKIDPDVESMAMLDPRPSSIVGDRRDHRMLADALRRLPIRLQIIVQLHYWDQLKVKDIAAIEGISPSGMRNRLMRARELLAQHLAELDRTTPLFAGNRSVTPSDEDLCLAWAAGNRRAGQTLSARYYANVSRFFRFKVGHHQAVDLTQATFLAAQEGITRKRTNSSFRSWLFGIARNKLLKHLRNRSRDQQRFDPEIGSIADFDQSPTILLHVEQRHRLLLAALRRLPFDVQVMIELHYWENLDYAEISEILGKPLSTIKTRMSRGRRHLDQLMVEMAHSKVELETTRGGLEGWAARVARECEGYSDCEDSRPS
jgi:RNA polymerase sigma-70 factor (ECF subfamily)